MDDQGSISFDILVADKGLIRNFVKMGTIVYNAAIASESCDHRVIQKHFLHKLKVSPLLKSAY